MGRDLASSPCIITMGAFSLVLDLSLVGVSLYLFQWWYSQRSGTRKIPGPAGLPIIGNFFDIPKEDEPQVFSEWASTYGMCYWLTSMSIILYSDCQPSLLGDISTVKALGKQIVILNSPKLAYDMLVRKASIYSDR